MKSLLLAASAFTLTLLTLVYLSKNPSSDRKRQFLDFKKKYNKSYGTKSEIDFRFGIFSENMDLIESSNASSEKRFTLGMNEFGDLSFEEFKNRFLMEARENTQSVPSSPLKSGSIDWRRVPNAVGPIKNQGHCGSCWAFSTVTALETGYALRYDNHVSFSEQELIDCSSDYGNHGCNGGLMPFAFEYVMDNQISTEKDYPYKGVEGQCRASSMIEKYSLDSFAQIDPVNVNGLIAAIETTVISVSIEVQNDFMFYSGGVYHSDKKCGSQLNHAIAAVGYNTEASDPYFIIRNSWGTEWGIGGYVNMSIGTESGTCGVANPTDSYPLYA